MKTIHPLSEHLINQIAAGEVIENPASVVKELVENAIDAKAHHIYVSIESGGMDKILVIDDGIGMSKEDLKLSIHRHTTSKIQCFEDLFDLHTMGFRGEALASIASCSTLKIRSKHINEPHGNEIIVKHGRIVSESPCAIAKGTKIEVMELFSNLPARKKFQKKALTNISIITKTMHHLALSHFSIGFTFVSNERKIFDFPSIEQEKNFPVRVKKVLKIDEGKWWKNTDLKFSGFGFFSEPYLSKKTRTSQYLFINGRWVYSGKIFKAVIDGYGTRIQEGTFPPFFLHLTLPKDQIDVNVHPQKKEIRFLQLQEIYMQIVDAIHEIFSKTEEPIFIQEAPKFTYEFSHNPSPPMKLLEEPYVQTQMYQASQPEEKILSIVDHFALIEGVIFQEKGLFLFDLKSAWESCLFEKFQQTGSMASQTLLLPIPVQIPQERMEVFLSKQDLIQKWGFSFHSIGENSLLVEEIPKLLKESEVISFFEEICQDLTLLDFSNTLKKKARKNLACVCEKMAQKKIWTLEDAQYIFKKWKDSKQISTSPRGKKIVIPLHPDRLHQLFEK